MSLPSIEVAIASTRKDFAHLDLVVRSLIEFSENPIETVTIVVPSVDVELVKTLTEACVCSEEDFLPDKLINAADRFSQIGRRGWVIQQLIGLHAAWKSASAGVLVCDSDTVMRASRVWVESSGVQILSYSYEYHRPYEDHCERVWGIRSRHQGLSYVTHHMMMQPDIVRRMFPTTDDLRLWVELADYHQTSSLADYHSYGRWLIENVPERALMARWRNFRGEAGDRQGPRVSGTQSRKVHRSFLSQSLHSYL